MDRKQRIISRLTGHGAVYPTGENQWEAEVLEDGFLVGMAFGTSKQSATERAKLMAAALKQPANHLRD